MDLLTANRSIFVNSTTKVAARGDVRQNSPKDNLFSKIASGQAPLPPAAKLLGLQVEHVEHDAIELSFHADSSFLNPADRVQGVSLSAMLDETLSIAALVDLNAGQRVVTLEMNVQFIKAAVSGELRARGRVVSRSNRIAFTEAELIQNGKLVARGTATIAIREI